MPVDDDRREQLRRQLDTAVGPEATTTMFELLPPAGTAPATREQVVELSARMDRGFEHVNTRIDGLEQRMDGLEQRMDGLGQRTDRLGQQVAELAHQVDRLPDRLTAQYRGELVAVVAGQTRAILLAVVTTLVGTASLAAALAQFG